MELYEQVPGLYTYCSFSSIWIVPDRHAKQSWPIWINQQVIHIISKRKLLVTYQDKSSTGLCIIPSRYIFSNWDIMNGVNFVIEALTSQVWPVNTIVRNFLPQKWYHLEYPTHFLPLVQCHLLKLMIGVLCRLACHCVGTLEFLMISYWFISKSYHIVTHYMTDVASTNHKIVQLYQNLPELTWSMIQLISISAAYLLPT